jgi:hypothetical protein
MNSPFYKSGFPEIKKENKGKFTAWAKTMVLRTLVLLHRQLCQAKINIAKRLLRWPTTQTTSVAKTNKL